MWYAMREALAIVSEEGLEAMWKRHVDVHNQLWQGLNELGLQPFVENPDDRLITVNTIKARRCQGWWCWGCCSGGSGGGAVDAVASVVTPLPHHCALCRPPQVPEGIDWAAVCANAMNK